MRRSVMALTVAVFGAGAIAVPAAVGSASAAPEDTASHRQGSEQCHLDAKPPFRADGNAADPTSHIRAKASVECEYAPRLIAIVVELYRDGEDKPIATEQDYLADSSKIERAVRYDCELRQTGKQDYVVKARAWISGGEHSRGSVLLADTSSKALSCA